MKIMPMVPAGAAALALSLFVCLAPAPAFAQDPAASATVAPAAQPAAGTLTVERMTNGPVAAPEVRFSDVDGHFGTLIGGYAGWITDDRLLIGGGGSWLANGSHDRELAYGGVIVEYRLLATERLGFGVRGLVGGGGATLAAPLSELPGYRPGAPMPSPTGRGSRHVIPYPDPDLRVVFREYFFVFEPQADVQFGITRWLRLTGGVGYRVIGAADGFEDRLRGVSGSIAVQFVGGS